MDLIHIIKKEFDGFIDEKFKHKETLHRFYKHHDRKHVAINNIAAEIKEVERRHVPLDYNEIKGLTRSIAHMYCKALINTEEKKVKKQFHQGVNEYGDKMKKMIPDEPEIHPDVIEATRGNDS